MLAIDRRALTIHEYAMRPIVRLTEKLTELIMNYVEDRSLADQRVEL